MPAQSALRRGRRARQPIDFVPHGWVSVVYECPAGCSGCDSSHRVLYRDPAAPDFQLCRYCLERAPTARATTIHTPRRHPR